MKKFAITAFFLAFTSPLWAQLPFPCSTAIDSINNFGEANPPVILDGQMNYLADHSAGFLEQLKCRDGKVVMWIWQTQNCTGECEAAKFQHDMETIYEPDSMPPDVPHSCQGCLFTGSTKLPISCPTDFGDYLNPRAPIVGTSGISGFTNDPGLAIFSRYTCRDSGEVVMWTWQVDEKTCNGPCKVRWVPSDQSGYWPTEVPHLCQGCLFPFRNRAVKPAGDPSSRIK